MAELTRAHARDEMAKAPRNLVGVGQCQHWHAPARRSGTARGSARSKLILATEFLQGSVCHQVAASDCSIHQVWLNPFVCTEKANNHHLALGTCTLYDGTGL